MQLVLKQTIREIKNSRSVKFGIYYKKECVVKIFYSQHEYRRELKGILLLKSNNIKTPSILFNGLYRNKWYIILERIKNAQTLDDFFKSDNTPQLKNKVALNLIKLYQEISKSNIVQIDNYLKNYLIDSQNNIFVIDGGLIKKVFKYSFIKKIKYQSLLFSKLNFEQFTYCVENYEYKNNIIFIYFYNFFKFQEIIKYKKKCLRNSSDFKVYKNNFFKLIQNKKYNFDLNLLENINSLKILKDGHTCTVFQYNDLVIKRYNIKNFRHFLKLQLFKSRAIRSWQSSNVFKLLNIRTPEPVCVIQKKWFFFNAESFFVSKHIRSIDIIHYLDESNQSGTRFVYKQLNYFIRLLCFHKIYHSDLKFSNILIEKKSSLLNIIDLDAIKFFRFNFIFKFFHKKDLKRLSVNFQKKIIHKYKLGAW